MFLYKHYYSLNMCHFLSGNQQNASFTFVSLANLFCCFLSMALIMVPKMLFIRKHAHDPREKEDDERDTAEQELKYREVIRENESLQKNIAEVSRVVQTYMYANKEHVCKRCT